MSHIDREEGFLNNTLGPRYTFLLSWAKSIEIPFLCQSQPLKTKLHSLPAIKES